MVIPDMLSKKASVNDKFRSENTKGREPKIAILNQDKAVNIKAGCVLLILNDQCWTEKIILRK